MSEIFAGQLTAVANVVLAVFAIATAVLAGLAFRKQAREVSDQAAMLDLQRRQLAEQEKTSAKQGEVLELQAKELSASLEERIREAEGKRRAQAAQVTAWFAWAEVTGASSEGFTAASFANDWGPTVRNASDLPVFDVRVTFNYIAEQANGREWAATPCGTLVKPIRVMPPMSERHFSIPSEVRNQITECSDDVYAVSIWFTDAAGNRWERDPRGALNPIS